MILDFNLTVSEPFKIVIDAFAFSTAVAAAMAAVPIATAFLSLVWVIWRLYNEWLTTKKLKGK